MTLHTRHIPNTSCVRNVCTASRPSGACRHRIWYHDGDAILEPVSITAALHSLRLQSRSLQAERVLLVAPHVTMTTAVRDRPSI